MFETKYFDKVAFCVGCCAAIIFLKRIIDFMLVLLRTYLLTWFRFSRKVTSYGEWAVVTGATDGIGKEYAKQLASQGLKIVLVSRSKPKLQTLAKELESLYKVETKVVVFDFVQQYGYDIIEERIKDLDVGILINNVGMNYPENNMYFQNSDIEMIADMLNVNIISLLKMTRMVVGGMIQRKRGAVVHLSSGSVYITAPFNSVYPATKKFVQKFVQLLQLEDCKAIHHQIVTPLLVESKMSNAKAGFTVPTAEQYVKSAIKTIGIADVTCGCVIHELIAAVIQWVPPVILVPIVIRSRNNRYNSN